MSLYLKLFKTTNQYNAYTADTANFIKPNVSNTEDAPTKVYYNPLDPYNGHEYVEIGGLKWATMNIGASSVTDYGLYFQWGDVSGYTAEQVGTSEGKKAFNWSDYKFNPSGDGSTFTKYNSTDGLTTLVSSDDAATANWGGRWRMPTVAEFQALGDAVNTALTADYQGSGIAGIVCTDKTDSSKVLFFPAAGHCGGGNVSGVGSGGNYWSSSLGDIDSAYQLTFYNRGADWGDMDIRESGYPVRGVAN